MGKEGDVARIDRVKITPLFDDEALLGVLTGME